MCNMASVRDLSLEETLLVDTIFFAKSVVQLTCYAFKNWDVNFHLMNSLVVI